MAGGFDRSAVALGFARMADAVANSFLIVVLPLYIASGRVHGGFFGLHDAAITGLVLGVFGIANAFAQPFAGRMSDRARRRRAFVVAGLLALAVFNFGYVFAASYWMLLLLRVGQGLSAAFTITASVALVSEASEPGTRGGNMGIYNSLRLVGFGVGPLAAGFVVAGGPYDLLGVHVTGYDLAFFIATVGALVGAGLVMLLVRDPERVEESVGDMSIPFLAADDDHLLHPIFALGVGTLVMALCIALLASIETQVNHRLDQDSRWFGIQFAVFILSLSATQPFVGRLSDRWGRRNFVIAGLVLLAPTTLAQGLVTSSWGMVFARLAQGLAGSMAFAPALALAGDITVEGQTGVQLSVLTMSFGLGLSAGQFTAGFLAGLGYLVPFAVGAALAVLAAGVVWREVAEPA